MKGISSHTAIRKIAVRPSMPRKPTIGEANLAALIGAVIGSVGGLFALGLMPAIVSRRLEYLIAWPKLSLACFFLCGVTAWFLAGQIGPRLEGLFGERIASIIGGLMGGLLPLASLSYLGWFLATTS